MNPHDASGATGAFDPREAAFRRWRETASADALEAYLQLELPALFGELRGDRYRAVRPWMESSDLAQTALRRVLTQASSLELASPAEFRALLRRIVKNRFVDVLRKEGGRRLSDSLIERQAGSDPSEQALWVLTLEETVARLPQDQHDLIRAVYFEGKSQKEHGQELGLDKRRVSELHAQALLRLESLLGAAAGEGEP